MENLLMIFFSRTDTMKLEIDAVDNSNKITVMVNGNNVQKGNGRTFLYY
jgi:hypothetical protein